MPIDVQQVFGFALYNAQVGLTHPDAKPLRGFGSAGVLEVVEDRGVTHTVRSIRFDLPALFMCSIVFRRNQKQAWLLPNENWT